MMTCSLMYFVNTHATVFKCVDENQTIHYQTIECKEQQKSSVMNVSEEAEQINYTVQKKSIEVVRKRTENSQSKSKTDSKEKFDYQKQQCRFLKSDYRKRLETEFQKCKKYRDIFCDKIEKINHTLKYIKKEIKKYRC